MDLFENIFPKFGKGRILKKEMLDNLRDYPRDFLDIYFKDYSDGIIWGAEAIVGNSSITITKGIVKHHDRIYMLTEEMELPYYATNKDTVIKIKFLEGIPQGDFHIYETKVFIDDQTALSPDELELGRFKLREGAQLRSGYTDFYDFSTEYNTINLIHVEYSSFKKSTLNPLVMRYFSQIVLKNRVDNYWDSAFALQCMNNPTVDREAILYYLYNRQGVRFEDYSNMEIYRYLCLIIKEIESGVKRKVEDRQSRPARIIVD